MPPRLLAGPGAAAEEIAELNDGGEVSTEDLLAAQMVNFANSPDLSNELMSAIIDAFNAHTAMSKQALDSEKIRRGLQDILLGPAQLYEALREKSGGASARR